MRYILGYITFAILFALVVPPAASLAGTPDSFDFVPAFTGKGNIEGLGGSQSSVVGDAPRGWTWHPAGKITVPILLYHHVAWEMPGRSGEYSVAPENFASQIQNLYCWGYTSLPLSYVAMVIREGGWLPPRPLVITFDDGYSDVIENALPVLNHYNYTATVFIIVQQVGVAGYLDWNDIQFLEHAGWEIGSHSYSHTSLRSPLVSMRKEIQESMEDLNAKLDQPVKTFSYPYAVTSTYVKRWVEGAGYQAAVGTGGMFTHRPEQLYFMSRINIPSGISLVEFSGLLPWSGNLIQRIDPDGISDTSHPSRGQRSICPNPSIYTISR